eukprot:TRINITY_DN1796_c0_g1_i2.p1 TRINITY_DN1796_c0_g1~~TRINITY_DN1796_c0_g1_i2.p1  ORF type:complete len:304 (+),score=71.00 TRINITY_DN1796_c0_g1_i2:196-1107(+)
MAAADIKALENELKDLSKKRAEVETRLRGIESKGRGGNRLLGGRDQGNTRGSILDRTSIKRTRDDRNDRRANQTDSHSRKVDDGDNRKSAREEEPVDKKPRLSSAVVSANPVAVVGEKPRPTLDLDKPEEKSRTRKLFGNLLLGTLNKIKTESTHKSQAVLRREEIDRKINAKVIEETKESVESRRRNAEEEKQKEIALREEIKQKQQEKQAQLLQLKWDLQHEQLGKWKKTETKPFIYFRPVKELAEEEAKEIAEQKAKIESNLSSRSADKEERRVRSDDVEETKKEDKIDDDDRYDPENIL